MDFRSNINRFLDEEGEIVSHSSLSVARYLLDRAEQDGRVLTPMKIIKLVYMAHGWMLGLYGRPLISDDAEAWRYGPVIPDLYQAVKRFGGKPVPPDSICAPDDETGFDHDEVSIMDQTMNIYGRRTAIRLSRMTHAPGTPWDTIYNKIGDQFVIPNDLIEEHYRQLYEVYGDADSGK